MQSTYNPLIDIGRWRVRPCGICGSAEFERNRRWPKKFPGWPGILFSRCSSCGLGCFQPQPSADSFQSIYTEHYYQTGYLAVKQRYQQLIPKILNTKLSSYVRPHRRVLDVGSGPGFWLEALQSLGCHAEGIEPSEAARRRLTSKFTVHADWSRVPGDWDVVLLMDVLGHIAAPGETLDEIVKRLKPGGVLVIRFPTFHGIWLSCSIWRATLKNESPFGLPDLLWQFHPRDLAAWLPSKGLRVVKRYREIQPWATGGRKTRLFRWLCAACDFVTGNGDEYYTIATKV
jgi:2-polyprenyl-3-methyl-5-hydroxy-6-metoxy-1,4-benzoquinol methylase